MIKEIMDDCSSRMQKAVEALERDLASIRAGRATPALLDRIHIDYYGVSTPLKQVGNISTPEARLLVVQPWDKNIISDIEKAIIQSDLGLNPSNDGNVIRLIIPQLTEERRKELDKVVRKKAEEGRVAIRNIRRDVNETIKDLQNEGELSEDEARRELENVQERTDKFIEQVNLVLAEKEKEIMEV